MGQDKRTSKKREETATIERNAHGQFASGVSGNPNGRPRGSSNALLARAREAASGVLDQLIDRAIGGCVISQKQLLDYAMPKGKPMPEPMRVLPGFPHEAEPRVQQGFIMGAMAAGMLSSDEAALYLNAIQTMGKLPRSGFDLNFDETNPLPSELDEILDMAMRGEFSGDM